MLVSQIESILFVLNKPIKLRQIAKLCGRSKDEVEVALESLKERYNKDESGINILQNNDDIEMTASPKNSDLLADFLKEEITSDLTRPQLETLTVIAYRGPISKLDLERIRGVNCSLILRNLLIKDLIEVKGDKLIDNNIYTISIEFMKHLGIRAIEELPRYEELAKREEIEDALSQ
ncbi:MAG: SMC-Scp complex subunit ScpB [Candidatus Kuenenbacteria bacterium]